VKIFYNDHELPDTPENRKEYGPTFRKLISKKRAKLKCPDDIKDNDKVLHTDEEYHSWKNIKGQYVQGRHLLHVKSVKSVTKRKPKRKKTLTDLF